MAYRNTLRAQQAEVTSQIESVLGKEIDVVWNLTLAANIISANVRYGDVEAIKGVSGVKSVILENRYEPLKEAEIQPDTAGTTMYMVGATDAWENGITGAGSRIAIVDTGTEDEHMSFDPDGLEYSFERNAEAAGKTLDEYKESLNLLTLDEILSVAGELNAPVDERAYINEKVAYAYNYIDGNFNTDHSNDSQGNHGSHVSGIAAANRYVYGDNGFVEAATLVGAVGVAPDAQILTMKVFGARGGAYDSDYMAAIEDAMVLNCDAVNLSLGSSVTGWAYSDGYQEIMDSLVEAGTVSAFSAGNNDSWSNNAGVNFDIEDHGEATGGSPGSFVNSLSTASADNTTATGYPLIFNGSNSVFYTETSGYGNEPIATIPGNYEYVYVDAPGTDADFKAVDDILDGKVALCNRGATSFYEKANAAVKYGAIAVVIVNNQPGTISMNLTGYEYTAPCVSITQANGEAIKAASTAGEAGGVKYYTGSVEVSSTLSTAEITPLEDATVSSFSSWGGNGSLLLKPEITTPGGSIFSVDGLTKDGYTNMSGTSMAAPHTSGLSALVGQYLRENELAANGEPLHRQMIQSLLMGTASPMKNDGKYISLLQQGAGLANAYHAISAKTYIMMGEDATISAADGKVKAEFGDDPAREGVYSYTFTANNITDTDAIYELSTDMFTQDTADGELLKTTRDLEADVDYEIISEVEEHDVDMDGDTDEDDAQAILDYLTGVLAAEDVDLEAAELDGVEGVTSRDAYILLQWLQNRPEEGQLVVPANGSATVKVTITITSDLSEYINGAFIEGFTYLTPVTTTEDGENTDVEQSIPLYGFWGSWTDASMFDKDIVDGLYDEEETYIAGTYSYLNVRYPGDTAVNAFTGNPYIVEETFPEDKLAVQSETLFASVHYTLLKNARKLGFAAVKEDGTVLATAAETSSLYAPYYYPSQGTWMNTNAQNATIGLTPKALGLNAGDVFTAGYYAIPEYYGMLMNDYASSQLSSDQFKELVADSVKEDSQYGLGKGALLGYTFTVDNEAPEIISAEEEGTTLKVTVKDNQYVAYVALMDASGRNVFMEAVPESSAAGAEATVEFDTSSVELPEVYTLFVGDYAANENAKLIGYTGGTIEIEKEVYVLTDTLEANKDYMILSANEAGAASALNNPATGGSYYPTDSSAVQIQNNGEVTYVEAAGAGNVWTYTEATNLMNAGAYLGYMTTNGPFHVWSAAWGADRFTYDAENSQMRVNGSRFMNFDPAQNAFVYAAAAGESVYLFGEDTITVEFDPSVASEVLVDPSEKTLIVNVDETVALTAKVYPITLEDKTVTWSTSDAAVATVDENGVVTAVAAGTATITAASNKTPEVTGTCEITVLESQPVDSYIFAEIKDDEGTKVVHIDMNDMTVTPVLDVTESTGNAPWKGGGRNGMVYWGNDTDDYFYGLSLSDGSPASSGFAMNTTYEIQDGAAMPKQTLVAEDGTEVPFNINIVGGASNGYFEMLFDESSVTYFNLSSIDVMVANTFIGSSDGVDYLYYALGSEGTLYILQIVPSVEDGDWSLNLQYGEIGKINGLPFNDNSFQFSMGYQYYEYGADAIVIADNDSQSLWFVELPQEAGDMEAQFVGKVAGATALTGLFNSSYDGIDTYDEANVPEAPEWLGNVVMTQAAPAVTVDMKESQAEGSLNAISASNVHQFVGRATVPFSAVNAKAGIVVNGAEVSPIDDEHNVSITLTEDVDVNNGLVTVTYDAETFEYIDGEFTPAFSSVNAENEGEVKFAYADLEAVAAGEAIATLNFKVLTCEDTTITVTTNERNDELDLAEEETFDVEGTGHDWAFSEIVWADDYSAATAIFICNNNNEHVLELPCEVTKEVIKEATKEESGEVKYTATVEGPDGETYTDIQIVTIPPETGVSTTSAPWIAMSAVSALLGAVLIVLRRRRAHN